MFGGVGDVGHSVGGGEPPPPGGWGEPVLPRPGRANPPRRPPVGGKGRAGGGGVVASTMGQRRDYAAAIRTAVEAGVDAVVSGAGLPLELPGIVGTTDVAIAPIVSSGRAAKLILRRWAKEFGRTADFVVIEGCKAGGHLGFAEDDLLAGKCQTLDDILPEVLAEVKPFEAQFGHSIPVFVAGGVPLPLLIWGGFEGR